MAWNWSKDTARIKISVIETLVETLVWTRVFVPPGWCAYEDHPDQEQLSGGDVPLLDQHKLSSSWELSTLSDNVSFIGFNGVMAHFVSTLLSRLAKNKKKNSRETPV